MSALPSHVPDDVAPISPAVQTVPIGGGATVVPLIHGASGPVGVTDRRARRATEPTVLRLALLERLAQAHAVTVVSAPAASGKTRLLHSWIAEAGHGARAGWVTVRRDERDERRLGSPGSREARSSRRASKPPPLTARGSPSGCSRVCRR